MRLRHVENFVWVGTRVPPTRTSANQRGPGRRGRQGQRQFSEAEFRLLAERFDFVVIAAFHCGGNRDCHNEAAQRLKRLNPNMTVLAYHNALIREYPETAQLQPYGTETFDDSWYLRNRRGEVVEVRDARGAFVDTTESGYRSWVIEQVLEWMEAAPFDGVAFDRSYGLPQIRTWQGRLGNAKITALNEAIVELIGAVKAALGPDKLVIYNGLKDRDAARQGRLSTDPLPVSDGVANEYFCYHKDWGFDDARINVGDDVLNDVRAHYRIAQEGKIVLVHVSYQGTLADRVKAHINRFCYGSFLLGHVPGLTSYKFGSLTTVRVLHENAPEKNIPLGDPVGEMQQLGRNVYRRDFENGVVVVNFGTGSATFRPQQAVVSMDGERRRQPYAAGSDIVIPPRDAVYLVRPDAAGPPS